jgi:hypothetical protein
VTSVVDENVVGNGSGFFVAREMYADRYNGLKAFYGVHVGEGRMSGVVVVVVVVAWWVEDQHAEADERVAEEDCDAEEDHDEEDVDLLAKISVG